MKIRTREKCPKCGGRFTDVGWTYICVPCADKRKYIRPRRYYLEFTWRKKQRKLYSDDTGKSFDNYGIAEDKSKEILKRIYDGSFDLRTYQHTKKRPITFEKFAEKWIWTYKKRLENGEIAPQTLIEVRNFTRLYYLPFFTSINLIDICNGIIEDFYLGLPNNLCLSTKHLIMKFLHKVLADAKDRGHINMIPKFPSIKFQKNPPKWLSNDEIQIIYDALPDYCKDIFFFLWKMGARPCEARALHFEDIDWNNKTVTIQRNFSGNVYQDRTKSKTYRTLPLHPDVYEILVVKDRRRGYIFLDNRFNPYNDIHRLYKIWSRTAKKLGYEQSNPYILRHSFASNATNRGVPIQLISEFMGHKTLGTTKIYAHINCEGLKKVLDL